MQDSFSFRESSAIFTDLSFLIVITAGVLFRLISLILFSRFFESVLILVSPFVVPVLRLFSIECL